ncbi:MAG TPA: hypothetical protein VKU41_30745 [Polyangiaceae bacterium]|nr:hypothetical protein [Polyangiaceae bacterium]
MGLLASACGGGGDQPPAGGDLLGFDGAAGVEGGGGGRPDAGPVGEGGAPSLDSGGGDATTDAISDARAGDVTIDVPPAPALCIEKYAWGAAHQWTADAIDRFGGVSATGLTLSWTRTNGEIVVDDRPGGASDFFPPIVLPAETLQPMARVALDPGGILLVGVAPSGTDFVVLRRVNTTDVLWFDTPPPTDGAPAPPYNAPFDAIRTAALQAGATVSEPVLSASGEAFFYLQTPSALPTPDGGDDGGDATTADASNEASSGVEAAAPVPVPTGPPVLYESRWNAGAMQWAAGVAVTVTELQSTDATHRRRPTGASADDLTLFFYDEVANVQRAAWRADVGAPFTHFEDVPGAPEAAPNAGCSALYYRGQGDAGTQGVLEVQ